MYLFLLVGNPIYCRLYCQRMMHPNPWVITEQRWWTSDKLVITLWNCFWRPTCSAASAVKLPCCLNSEQKKNWKEWIWKNSIGLFDKRCVYIRVCVHLLVSELLLWDRSTFILHFLFIVVQVARFLPINSVWWWGVGGSGLGLLVLQNISLSSESELLHLLSRHIKSNGGLQDVALPKYVNKQKESDHLFYYNLL